MLAELMENVCAEHVLQHYDGHVSSMITASVVSAGFPGHRGVRGGGVGGARHREEAARRAHQPAEPLGGCHADDALQLRDRAVAGAVRTTVAMGGMALA